MPNILTPLSIWNNFDDSLPSEPVTIEEREEGDVKFEKLYFYGRKTEAGRVKIYGEFACDLKSPAKETVLIFPDSADGVDEELLKFFVRHGYSALGVDYRGKAEGAENYTVYPEDVAYANTETCGRYKDFVDDSADKTSWYEWVAVGVYARKYLAEERGCEKIGVVGLRDGGEIAWKLAVAKKFSCVVPVCAAGWAAYSGISKYRSDEQELNEERYRFIAGIDSQAYAPYVQCPVLMLCSTNDRRFDYDRAYDTFSRINHEYINDSVISYSLKCDASIGVSGTKNMFMYLDKFVKNRQVFIPHPSELTVSVDDNDNLIATASFDSQGEVEKFGVFMAEDCIDSSLREWTECEYKRKISDYEHEYFMNIYDRTSTVFAICYAEYKNGFTVWSKLIVKKISGKFRNMQDKCRVIYSNKDRSDGFVTADGNCYAIGGIFFENNEVLPQVVTKAKGIKGLYSVCGLTTYRMNNPRYSPEAGNVLKVDLFCDETAEVEFSIEDVTSNEVYICPVRVLGGVWQTVLLESKFFKTLSGASLPEYSSNLKLNVNCAEQYAINNVMWL